MSGRASAVLAAPWELDVTDLPARPPSKGERTEPVPATDRVKPATNKPEPRFEAARQRLAREYKLRARAEAARLAREAEEAATAADTGSDDEPTPPRKGFSFNQTTRRPTGGERNGSDGS